MSLHELEAAVTQLPAAEFEAFSRWFEEFRADAWDRQIEENIAAGRLNSAGARADTDFDENRCTPL